MRRARWVRRSRALRAHQPRLLDGRGGGLADGAEQAAFGAGEVAGFTVVDADDADGPAVEDHARAHERAETLGHALLGQEDAGVGGEAFGHDDLAGEGAAVELAVLAEGERGFASQDSERLTETERTRSASLSPLARPSASSGRSMIDPACRSSTWSAERRAASSVSSALPPSCEHGAEAVKGVNLGDAVAQFGDIGAHLTRGVGDERAGADRAGVGLGPCGVHDDGPDVLFLDEDGQHGGAGRDGRGDAGGVGGRAGGQDKVSLVAEFDGHAADLGEVGAECRAIDPSVQ
jgi:hypothetical protein